MRGHTDVAYCQGASEPVAYRLVYVLTCRNLALYFFTSSHADVGLHSYTRLKMHFITEAGGRLQRSLSSLQFITLCVVDCCLFCYHFSLSVLIICPLTYEFNTNPKPYPPLNYTVYCVES